MIKTETPAASGKAAGANDRSTAKPISTPNAPLPQAPHNAAWTVDRHLLVESFRTSIDEEAR